MQNSSKNDIVRMKIIAAMLGIVDAEMKEYAEMVSPRFSASPSRWANDLEALARLHKLTVEGRRRLVELATPIQRKR